MPSRRFPPPWSAEVTPNCFIVRDADGQQLASVYYESEPGRRSAAKLLSKDEARRIAANFAKLPGAVAEGPLSDHAELGGAMKHLRVGMCISSEVIQIW